MEFVFRHGLLNLVMSRWLHIFIHVYACILAWQFWHWGITIWDNGETTLFNIDMVYILAPLDIMIKTYKNTIMKITLFITDGICWLLWAYRQKTKIYPNIGNSVMI